MKIITSLFMFLAAFFWRFSLFAFQTKVPEPQAQSDPGPPPPGLVVPIDSNIVILIICGILLGVYFIIDRKRRLL